MTLDERKVLNSALIIYGEESQIMMCIEECAELTNALAKIPRNRVTEAEIITELADVSIIVDQLTIMYGEEKFFEERQRKINRLRYRLKHASIGDRP